MPQPGSIIYWNDFPLHNTGEQKSRYFLYMGKSGAFNVPILVNIFNITTRLEHYSDSGHRRRNTILRVEPGEYGLPQRSVIDFDMSDHPNKSGFDIAQVDLIHEFCERDIRTVLWPKIKSSKMLSPIVMKQIRQQLGLRGITGLRL